MKTIDNFYSRLHHAFGPLTGGIILDFFDFATLGPIGLAIGPFVGAAIGWWLGSLEEASTPVKVALALAAGIYLTIPFTAVIPVATILSACGRFWRMEEISES